MNGQKLPAMHPVLVLPEKHPIASQHPLLLLDVDLALPISVEVTNQRKIMVEVIRAEIMMPIPVEIMAVMISIATWVEIMNLKMKVSLATM